MLVGCVTLPGAPTPIASGVLGTFRFRPVATAQASSALNLLDVKLVNFPGELVTPGPAVANGVVNLVIGWDSDNDGCPNVKEDGANRFLGGQRDKTNPWDWFEDPNDGDTLVDYDDVLTVLGHVGQVPGVPGYSVVYDRTTGPTNAWAPGPPDGIIDFDDVLGELASFGHLC